MQITELKHESNLNASKRNMHDVNNEIMKLKLGK